MRHIASITVVLCLLLFAPLAMAQDQRVFVRTSFPTVDFPNQPNQQVILASQPVALAMRKLWSFDIFLEGKLNYGLNDLWVGSVDVWICDKIDCTGTIKANLADNPMVLSQLDYRFIHMMGTFAQTNRGHQTTAVLTGQFGFSISDLSGFVLNSGNTNVSDLYGPPTQPIDLYTGNRYLVLTMTSATCPSCQVSSSDTVTITIFRVHMLP